MKSILIALALLYGLTANSADFNKNDKVVLINHFGEFVTSNQNENGQVSCGTQHIDSWEIFKIKKVEDNKYYLEDWFQNNLYINEEGQIKYGDEEPSAFYIKNISGKNYLTSVDSLFFDCNGQNLEESITKNIIITNIDKRNVFRGGIKNAGIVFIIICVLIFCFLYYSIEAGLSLSFKWVMFLIFIASAFMSLFAINQSDFLGIWDEQYHALVGKNLSNFPFTPLLYKTGLLNNSMIWTHTTVWLHKQPLFLYQMALSIKLFGSTEIAVRLPSMLLMSVCGVFIFRMGKLMFSNRVGLTAALLFALCAYKNLLLMGLQSTDHNDIVFLAYITASFWAYVEYEFSVKRKKLFLILIGVFAGFAILNKWIVGLLVYLFIFFIKLFNSNSRSNFLRELWVFKTAFIATLIVAVPWQVYILARFPELAKYEYNLSSQHFFEVIEGHGGDWNFHLNYFPNHYGLSLLAIVVLLSFALLSKNRNKYTYSLFCSSLFVLIFYSFAATKMMSFTFIIAPFVFILIAEGIESIHQLVKSRTNEKTAKFLLFVIIVFTSTNVFNLDLIQHNLLGLRSESKFFAYREVNTNKIKLTRLESPEETVLFNCGESNNIMAMFYLDIAEAYEFIPNIEDMNIILENNYKLAIYDNGRLPSHFYSENENIILLPNY